MSSDSQATQSLQSKATLHSLQTIYCRCYEPGESGWFCLANIDFTLVLQKLKVKLNENDFVKFD